VSCAAKTLLLQFGNLMSLNSLLFQTKSEAVLKFDKYMMKFFFGLLLLTLCVSCTDNGRKKAKKPSNGQIGQYDLQQYKKLVLPQELDEISGIAYDSASKGLVAVNDEEGKLFFFNPANGEVSDRLKFAKKGDYEELFFAKGDWWILRSDGVFIQFHPPMEGQTVNWQLPQGEEYEAAWYDAATQKMWMLCKKCDGGKNTMTNITQGSANDTMQIFSSKRNYQLDFQLLPAEKKFHASGAAYNPADSMVYLLSSPDKKILRMSANGVVTDAQPLDPALFKQPEGICFGPDGTMYISNEAAGGNANLLIFKPQNQQP
jgi:uncharacterized protein YjiK